MSETSKMFSELYATFARVCSTVWSSVTESSQRFLDRDVSRTAFQLGEVLPCDLSHRCKVLVSCILYKIYFRDGEEHSLRHLFPLRFAHARDTRRSTSMHKFALDPVCCKSSIDIIQRLSIGVKLGNHKWIK